MCVHAQRHRGAGVPQVLAHGQRFPSGGNNDSARLAASWGVSSSGGRLGIGLGDGDASGTIRKLFALSVTVEKETGLTAYDPQVEMPLPDTPPQRAMGIMSLVTTDLRNRYGG
jgi:hypothetical protein